jgi:hypothetical protein
LKALFLSLAGGIQMSEGLTHFVLENPSVNAPRSVTVVDSRNPGPLNGRLIIHNLGPSALDINFGGGGAIVPLLANQTQLFHYNGNLAIDVQTGFAAGWFREA